jgi:hypothetical protein
MYIYNIKYLISDNKGSIYHLSRQTDLELKWKQKRVISQMFMTEMIRKCSDTKIFGIKFEAFKI